MRVNLLALAPTLRVQIAATAALDRAESTPAPANNLAMPAIRTW
jgi:hypothetical protein